MTTIDVGTLYVNNPNLKNKPMEEIKAFLVQVLESDLISNMNLKRKSKWDKVDEQLRNLKDVNEVGTEELEESFAILREEAKKSGFSDYNTARDEYLTNKYGV